MDTHKVIAVFSTSKYLSGTVERNYPHYQAFLPSSFLITYSIVTAKTKLLCYRLLQLHDYPNYENFMNAGLEKELILKLILE